MMGVIVTNLTEEANIMKNIVVVKKAAVFNRDIM